MAGALGLAVLVVTAGIGVTTRGGDAASACGSRAGCGTARLPAPITLTEVGTGYRIGPTGSLTRVAVARSRYPPGAIWFPGTGTWYRIARGHLAVGRGRRRLWRSHGTMTAAQLGVVAAGPAGVAFQHDHRLYAALLGGAEHAVARRELPLGWTTAGLYTYSYGRRALVLRSDNGALLATIARGPREYAYDRASRSVYFLSRGVVMRAQGSRASRLTSLNRLGMSVDTWLQPLSAGWLELMDSRRLTVTRPDGSLFASTPTRRLDRISSLLAVAPRGGAVAFTAVTGPASRPSAESVYLLRAGADAARVVHREPGFVGGCAEWAEVEWHGAWLLYSNSGGRLVAFDTAGAHQTVELTRLVHGLPGARHGLDAQWSR